MNTNKKDKQVDTVELSTLIELAEEFGLPLVEQENTVTLIGWVRMIQFKKLEETKCQTKIY